MYPMGHQNTHFLSLKGTTNTSADDDPSGIYASSCKSGCFGTRYQSKFYFKNALSYFISVSRAKNSLNTVLRREKIV